MEDGVEGGHKPPTYARGVVVEENGGCSWVTKGGGQMKPPVLRSREEREVVVTGTWFCIEG